MFLGFLRGWAGALAFAAALAMPAWPAGGGEWSWLSSERLSGLGDWRQRLALRAEEVWLGGWSTSEQGQGRLLRFAGAGWETLRPPGFGERTFVLASDPEGGLWVAPYWPDSKRLEPGLELFRFDGTRWERTELRPGLWPQALAMVSRRAGWVAGNRGRFARYDGRSWTLVPLDPAPDPNRLPDVLALALASAEQGWAVGTFGFVARLEAGRWRRQALPPDLVDERFMAVALDRSGWPWIVGANGSAARFDGRAWQRLPTGTRDHLFGITFGAAGEAWVVGDRGTLLRWGGSRFEPRPAPTSKTLFDILVTASGDGWIAAADGLYRAQAPTRFGFHESGRVGRLAVEAASALATAALDLDLDGRLDLALLVDSKVRVFRSQAVVGDELFAEPLDLPPPPFAGDVTAMAWGDGDGDGDLDLAVLGGEPAGVWLSEQKAPGRFSPGRLLAPAALIASLLGWLDVGGDGHLDLVLQPGVVNFGRLRPPWLLEGVGGGRFSAPRVLYSTSRAQNFLLWGELDGEAGADLLMAGDGNDLARFAGVRLPELRGRSALPSRSLLRTGALADLDGDADLDVLLLSDRLFGLANDGRGNLTFEEGLLPPLPHNAALFAPPPLVGDLDLDGRLDLLLSTRTEEGWRPRLLTRAEQGDWQEEAAGPGLTDLDVRSWGLGDWDGDGDLDLFVSGSERATLLENRTAQPGLVVRALGPSGGVPPFGTELCLRGPEGRAQACHRLGEAFYPTSAPALDRVSFGVPSGAAVTLEVRFPNGRTVERTGLQGGQVSVVADRSRPARWAWRLGRRLTRLDLRVELGLLCATALLALGGLRAGIAPRSWVLGVCVGAHGLALLAGAGSTEPSGWGRRFAFVGLGAAVLGGAVKGRAAWRRRRWIGPYRLLAPLGAGGMGVVHRARHRATGREVALKVLRDHRLAEPDSRRRLLREAAVLESLDHPAIVKVLDAGESEDQVFVALELLEGETLAECLAREGPLPVAAVQSLLCAASRALAEVHRHGLVHRDLSSRNLFLLASTSADWGARLRLTDFGLAQSLVASGGLQSDPSALVGTLPYLAPECLRGEDVDARADLYALGVLGVEMLTGRLPAGDGRARQELGPSVPEALADLIEELLSRERERRPASAEEVAQRLEAPGPSGPFLPRTELPWIALLERATASLAAHRPIEAQAWLTASLAELRAGLEGLSPEERLVHAQRQEVARLLELAHALEEGP